MARTIRRGTRVSSHQQKSSWRQISFQDQGIPKKMEHRKVKALMSERKDWKRAVCPVCLEFPHKAVLLLCSSHDKGCRPYICGTSYRFSNCLNQFKKAYSEKKISSQELDVDSLAHACPACKKLVVVDLKCPLCRGQVKGWTIVEPARSYLNKKKRACIQDNCSFIGHYKRLLKHVRAKHPSAKPRSIDPVLEQKWKVLENQREREDVISTIQSAMPNSVVWGDYVIDYDSDSFDDYDDLSSDGDEVFERQNTRNILIRERLHNRYGQMVSRDGHLFRYATAVRRGRGRGRFIPRAGT